MYLIWSFEHNAWWKPGSWGYTPMLLEAGFYTYDQAKRICEAANYGGEVNEEMRPVIDYVQGIVSEDWAVYLKDKI